MSAAPGPTITVVNEPALPADLTDTGALSVVATPSRALGAGPVECRNVTQVATSFGARTTATGLHDYARAFFNSGGSRLIVTRVSASDAVTATKAIPGSVGTSLYCDAISPGAWGNDLSVQIIDSSGSKIAAIFDGTTEVERTPAFDTQAAFRDWAVVNSDYVRFRVGAGTTVPAVLAKSSLSTGSDGSAIASSDVISAITTASTPEGTGQIACVDYPSGSRTTINQKLSDVADSSNRHALLDATVGLSISSLVSEYAAVTGSKRNVEYWAQQLIVPGPTQGSTSTVPASAVIAGLIAATDRQYGPSHPAAGKRAIADYVTALSTEYTDVDDRETLNDAGVNIMRTITGTIRPYSARTGADPDTDGQWVQASRSREVMRLKALLKPVLEDHEFNRIDGQGVELEGVTRDLEGVLIGEWQQGALYGATQADAFTLAVSVELDEDPATATVTADVAVTTSRFGEVYNLNLTHRLEV